MKKSIAFLFIFLSFIQLSMAAKPLTEVEKELKKMAFDILNHDSVAYKISLNKKFAALLYETLQRPESYNYPFDSLKTISMLRADDNSFRIFTWYIESQNRKENYGKQEHYYFGFVQRVKKDVNNKDLIVIPLIESEGSVQSIEAEEMNSNNWFGALYYPMKSNPTLPSLTFQYNEKTKNSKEKPKKKKRKVYVLLGWNGGDNTCNYKLMDLISFDDEKDPKTAIFGASIIYYGRLPKYRVVFKYSEYAPFGFNTAKVKYAGLFGLKPKEMVVYDHLAVPVKSNAMKEIWEMGPDGSYDALEINRRKGYIGWFKDVELQEEGAPTMSAAKMKKIQASREKAAKDMYGKDYKKFIKEEEINKKELTVKDLQKIQEEERKKLEEAGIKQPKMEKKKKDK